MKRKILFVWMLLLTGAASSFAQSGTCGTSLTWTYSHGTHTLTISGTGTMTDYSFDVPWYSYRTSIETVIIEDGVTSIGTRAFDSCTTFSSITIGNSVKSIGNQAFYNCSGLTSFTIGNSVKSIGRQAFSYCESLASITIGSGVTSIGKWAFNDCTGLTAINVSEDNAAYASEYGILFNREKTVLIRYPQGKPDENYTIPYGVTGIGDDAFSQCAGLRSITVHGSVESIGHGAFELCSGLTGIAIPESVASIGDDAFSTCENLASVTIGNGVKSIGDDAFYWCTSLGSITIPESVTSIGNGAFHNCKSLTAIDVSESNTAYVSENGVLFNKAKTTLIQYPEGNPETNYAIPNSVTGIGEGAFYRCTGLSSITIPYGVESIGEAAFTDCSNLHSTTIPNSVKSIGEYAFSGCNWFLSITIPNSVESIGERAFFHCNNLAEVTIGNSVTSIGEWAFSDCRFLTEVTNLNPTPQAINLNVFGYTTIINATLYVPAESVNLYQSTVNWAGFKRIIALQPSAIHAPAIANAVRIYSDPSTGNFRIEGITAPTQITVTDVSGKTLLQQTVKRDESISVRHLPKGVYLVRVNGVTSKIIKN